MRKVYITRISTWTVKIPSDDDGEIVRIVDDEPLEGDTLFGVESDDEWHINDEYGRPIRTPYLTPEEG